jgi:hypothetical protein
MAHIGQKLGFRVAGGLGFFDRVQQRFFGILAFGDFLAQLAGARLD